MNDEMAGVVRASAEDERDAPATNCRLLAENGRYLNWNGGALTSPEQIGNAEVLARGVMQAVDVFLPDGRRQFFAGVAVCLRGEGQMLLLDASTAPRSPQDKEEWTTDAFPGFTCATLYAPGTLVLVTR
jgi:hypothetical protein